MFPIDRPLRIAVAGVPFLALPESIRLALAGPDYELLKTNTPESLRAIDCLLLGADVGDADGWKRELAKFPKPGGALACAVIVIALGGSSVSADEVFRLGAHDLVQAEGLDAGALRWAIRRACLLRDRERLGRHIDARNAELAAVVLASSDAIMSADAEDRVRSWNPGAEALFGYREQEALGRTIDELLIPEHLQEERRQFYAHVRAGRSINGLETMRRRKDGSLVWVEVNCSPMYGEDGAVNGITIIYRDISERKRTEDALRLSEDKYARAFAGNPAAIALTRLSDGEFLEVNDTWVLLNGYARDEVLGKPAAAFPIWPDLAGREAFVQELRTHGVVKNREHTFRKKNGETFYAQLSAHKLSLQGEDVILSTLVDITERRRAETALRDSETLNRSFLEASPDCIEILTASGDLCFMNAKSLEAACMADFEAIKGLPYTLIWPEAMRPRIAEAIAVARAGDSDSFEGFCETQRGIRRYWDVVVSPVRGHTPEIKHLIVTSRDITDRRTARDELLASQALFKAVIESTPDVIWARDRHGRFTLGNQAAFDLMGGGDPKQVLGSSVDAFTADPEQSRRIRENDARILATGMPEMMEERFGTSGNPSLFQTVKAPLRNAAGEIEGIVGVSRDVTERKRFEAALLDSEQRLRLAIDAVGLGVMVIDYLAQTATPDTVAAALYSLEAGVPTPLEVLHSRFHSDDREDVMCQVALSLDPDGPGTLSMEHRIVNGEGLTRWLSVKKQVNFVERGGQRVAASGLIMAFDITERKRAENEVARLNRRLARRIEKTERRLTTYSGLIQNNPFGVLLVDADQQVAQISQGAQKVFAGLDPVLGRDIGDIIRRTWAEPFATSIISRIRHTLETGESYTANEITRALSDGEMLQSYDWRIERVTLGDGLHGAVCHFYDMTERQHYEDKIRLLMREVNHRSKNVLMLVQAVARQTAAAGTEDFLTRFDQRLQALSTSQDLLVRGEWRSVALADLVHSQLAHFEDLVGSRISIEGPRLDLIIQGVQPLGMALHELATNAGKYGALANEQGRVELSWGVEAAEGGGDQFMMAWREFGGPPVEPPVKHGFGSTVLDRMVRMSLGGSVAIEYRPNGFSWRLECPLQNVIEGSAPQLAILPENARQAPQDGSQRILVVEDEAIVAIELSGLMERTGWSVVGPAASVGRALALIHEHGCDCAILDVNLGSETSEPIAAELDHRGIPYIMVSAYSREQLPRRMSAAPFLPKPVRPMSLVTEVRRCLNTAALH